jgi:hypothetical protein
VQNSGTIYETKFLNFSSLLNFDDIIKSLILRAPQAILGFMMRLAKLQELGLTPSNSLQFLTPSSS